ncbi:hypothetical protein F8M41_005293 [Gigaspora margarita]|uniref:Uncharacterized protein n=1 Tax=Gigaspora margarita TaxID=4874 RepID=A0A8H4B4T3_GIGMA|nr:hypothetical protein F8M41_005293 [Gigaspora margarita]
MGSDNNRVDYELEGSTFINLNQLMIQYKLGRPCGGGDNSTYCPFFETSVKKSYYTCQRIKIRENLSLEIKNRSHCEVDMDVDRLQSTNKSLNIQ